MANRYIYYMSDVTAPNVHLFGLKEKRKRSNKVDIHVAGCQDEP